MPITSTNTSEGNYSRVLSRLGDGDLGMKKAINLVLEDEDIIELVRILIDEDTDGAFSFLKTHFKGKARELLEGG